MTHIAFLIGWTMATVLAFSDSAIVTTGTTASRHFVMRHIDPRPVSKILVTSTAIVRSIGVTSGFVVTTTTLVYTVNLVVIHPGNGTPCVR